MSCTNQMFGIGTVWMRYVWIATNRYDEVARTAVCRREGVGRHCECKRNKNMRR